MEARLGKGSVATEIGFPALPIALKSLPTFRSFSTLLQRVSMGSQPRPQSEPERVGGETHLGVRAEGTQVALQISPRHQLHDDHSRLALGHHPEEANLEAPKAKESRLHPQDLEGRSRAPPSSALAGPMPKRSLGHGKAVGLGSAEAGIGESPEKSLVWETKSAPWKRRPVSLSIQFRGSSPEPSLR